MYGIIGKKLGVTRLFDNHGNAFEATIIEAGPCTVTQLKTKEKDGYTAVQLGFGEKKQQKVSKPVQGHLTKSGLPLYSVLREIRNFENLDSLKVGDTIKVNIFHPGDKVKVSGISKGKGFQGVVKRHHFNGGPKTHGQSDRMRAPGSLGQSSFPSRVYPGLRMAGRMGGGPVTMLRLSIVKVDPENNILIIKGSVPGSANGIVIIRK
jgi:large subunit ribosomal protein L3